MQKPTIIQTEMVVAVDIDNTLIRRNPLGTIKLPYGSSIQNFEPIVEHIELVKSYSQRGFFVILWSHGGFQHAQMTMNALKLDRYVNLVMTKPSKHIDDKESVEDIVGTRVFISQTPNQK